MLEPSDRYEIQSIVREYVTGSELKSIFENQYRTMLAPQVYGASLSHDAATGGPYSGAGGFPLGESVYDNDGFVVDRGSGRAVLRVPPALGGLYLIFADATIEPQPSPAATDIVLRIEIQEPTTASGSVPSSRSLGSSSAGQPSLHDSAFAFENLSVGTEVSLHFGTSNPANFWRSYPEQNRMTMIRIPFGTVR
ncbi:MAG: hypothetical protein VW438_00125 [Euryarchaeota archaeon]